MPQALSRFILRQRQPLVVAGTHGKTTTSSIAAWVYSDCGHDPGYLIGGIPKNLDGSFRIGRGPRFIIEGDEYNAAYFDRGPKFLHYRPHALILTSVEYDHADLYATPEDLIDAYRRLVALLPEDGVLVAFGDSDQVRDVASTARCQVIFYGLQERNDVHPLGAVESDDRGTRVQLADGDGGTVELRLAVPGEHNLTNALAVWAVARHDQLPANDVAGSLSRFDGAKRRLEELGTAAGITVVDDFAHHPTAVEKSLGGLRQRYPGRRLITLFEPRSLTAGRSFFRDRYLQAFAESDIVLLAPIFHHERLGDQRLDLETLAAELRGSGVETHLATSIDDLERMALDLAQPGDVLATMSSGSFDGLPGRLLALLQRRVT